MGLTHKYVQMRIQYLKAYIMYVYIYMFYFWDSWNKQNIFKKLLTLTNEMICKGL